MSDRSPDRHSPDPISLSELLAGRRRGDALADERIFSLVFEELRAMARRRLHGRPTDSLQATELVNELYLRLVGKAQLDCTDRRHFFAVAARGMEDILVERARRRASQKRGGDLRRVELNASTECVDSYPEEFLTLSDAISRLSKCDEFSAEVVRLRFFVGLSGDEVAEACGVSASTVDRSWKYARAWLHDALYGDSR